MSRKASFEHRQPGGRIDPFLALAARREAEAKATTGQG
jgi:glutamine synthetase